MATLTSGNCLELVHTKLVPRWVWIGVFSIWGAYRGAVGYRGVTLATSEAWGAPELALVVKLVSMAMVALLPLACGTARAFAAAIVPWYTCFFFFFFTLVQVLEGP